MKWLNCPKNPFMACSHESCISDGCVLIAPRPQIAWPDNRIEELEKRVTELENRVRAQENTND